MKEFDTLKTCEECKYLTKCKTFYALVSSEERTWTFCDVIKFAMEDK